MHGAVALGTFSSWFLAVGMVVYCAQEAEVRGRWTAARRAGCAAVRNGGGTPPNQPLVRRSYDKSG